MDILFYSGNTFLSGDSRKMAINKVRRQFMAGVLTIKSMRCPMLRFFIILEKCKNKLFIWYLVNMKI